MNWLNLEIKTLRSTGYIGSAPIERATWINALAYCCEQENGGRIVGARSWKDRQWQQLCGVTAREIDRADKLMAWEGDDLVVSGYPHAKEAEVRSKREAGREGGQRSGEARGQAKPKQKGSTASSTASHCASTEGEGEGERKEKEKGTHPQSPPCPPPVAAAAAEIGEHTRFIQLWTDAYPQHHRGEKYVFQGGKDGTAVKNLLSTSGETPAALMAVAVAAWKTPNGFNAKMAASLSGFNSKFNDIRNEVAMNKPKTHVMPLSAGPKGYNPMTDPMPTP